MRYYYAQVDANSVCYAVLDTFDAIDSPTMIQVPNGDPAYMGKRYEDGQWVEVPAENG